MSNIIELPPPTESILRKCTIEQVFDSNFIELIRLSPKNPFVRGLVLKLTGKMPPLECETFELVKEWVETTCERRRHTFRSGGAGISIRVEFAETESGHANYSVRRYGTEQFEIGADDLFQIIQTAIEAGGGIDEAIDIITGKIDNDAWNQCDPELDDNGEYDYTDHESRDHGDSEVEFSRNQIRDSVLAFLRARHPELAAEL